MSVPLRGFLPERVAKDRNGPERTKTIPQPDDPPVRRIVSYDPLWLMAAMMAIFFALMALAIVAG